MPLPAGAKNFSADAILRRYSTIAPLGEAELSLLRGLQGRRAVAAGAEIIPGEAGDAPVILSSGWGAYVRELADGRRQVLAFLLSGDIIGLRGDPRALSRAPAVALTELQVFDAAPILMAIRSGSQQWSALARAVRDSAAMLDLSSLNQIGRLGCLSAYERMCHLLLELCDRLAQAGLAYGDCFSLPVSQHVLADATGLSAVHVNRILQQLRRDRLVEQHSGAVRLLDREAMAAIAYYEPLSGAWS